MSFRDRCWYTLRCAHVTRAKRLAFPTRESAGAVRIGIPVRTFCVSTPHGSAGATWSPSWRTPFARTAATLPKSFSATPCDHQAEPVPHGVPLLCFIQVSTLHVSREAQPTKLPPGRGRKEIAIGEARVAAWGGHASTAENNLADHELPVVLTDSSRPRPESWIRIKRRARPLPDMTCELSNLRQQCRRFPFSLCGQSSTAP